ncbi:hypothetical protein [Isachenkonia alkalipeptolytica]|uniref:Phosphatidate cytidylyltransferase n=1 Tax=Isachenkonia alkalipeptolytica TaxID=2565777 RepID=A0AA43XLW8_9CLOT|nr:hypothetical protein [Isachenkonia alkalipeptolytica]NBG88714.1 hypothetical protein [Isachenkonia alkalipeptolytica]
MTERVEVAIGIFIGYFLVFGLSTGVIGRLLRIHPEIIRKVYHIFGIASMVILLYVFPGWKSALGTVVVFFIVAYGIVFMIEDTDFMKRFRKERRKEDAKIREQILYVVLVYSFLIITFWGIGGEDHKHFILFGTMTWCFGDALAALVGRFYGRKKFQYKHFDRDKTREGFQAFVLSTTLANLVILLIFYAFPLGVSIGIALLLGLAGGVIELMSKRGLDTVTIPIGITLLAYAVINGVLVFY